MSVPEPAAPRAVVANQACRQSTRDKLERIETTLRTMRRERAPVIYPAGARCTGVSRTFLYQNTDAKNLMTAAIASSGAGAQLAHDAQVDASWRQRALNAEDALKTAYAEIDSQRERIGILLGQLRDLQAEHAEGTAQRLAEENTALKQRVRQLTDDNRGLERKLQAARSNNRFLDRRLADLEAELLDTQLNHPTSARTRS